MNVKAISCVGSIRFMFLFMEWAMSRVWIFDVWNFMTDQYSIGDET